MEHIIKSSEDDWLEDTEPYRVARPRTIEVDRPVDGVLGATLSGTEQDRNLSGHLGPEVTSRTADSL